ncbi:AraC family transcriptional regulator [Nocardia higoensis]|uniref:AraC family transcriptional regulator n=1 Tax=Nocardia higoensis TaxID=228599 RepID=UPI0002EF374C|nr:AraC family transcriptional regulator [Nocardia higoensis]
MDLLSETVAAIRSGTPASGLFVRHAPWGRHYPIVPGAAFHVVLRGSCRLVPPGGEPLALGAGDVVFMPRGADHDLVDSPGTPITEIARPGEPRELPGPGERTEILCGAYELGRQRSHPLLDELPEFIHLTARPCYHPALRGVVDLLAAELAEPRQGGDAAIPNLLEIMLLFLLRAWFDEQAGARPTGWAAAFADPAVAAALRAVHEDPARPWTVADLADIAGVSRATLARRFTATIAEPPLAYVTRWRLLTAARLLRETDAPLQSIARKVGYTSEFAFAKAFKRAYGLAPGHYRHQPNPASIAV